ncbi:MAG TPA: MFS transporter [Candidatus Agrococcus pullicola]|uniref:MFS transporter n=1 Tax=Candidatus Agrococcus pullicola TaxID=2838429 RepID=A0A9D2C877_9MICO|nr:MFS transporter [Candidatus Agrococcus pullicola]
MSTYGEVLKTPGVASTLAAQLIGRFPIGMYAIGLLLHIQYAFDSYAAAGTVLAALSGGQAIATPFTTRLMSRLGTRTLLLITTTISVSSMFGIALLSAPLWVYIALGAATGLAMPPIGPTARTIYPRLLSQRQLPPLFSFDAMLQEIIFIMGPVAITFLVTSVNSTVALAVAASVQLVGSVWFALLPRVGNLRIPPTSKRMGAVLKKKPVRLVTVVGFLVIGGLAGAEAGIVAVYGHDGPEAGWILAIGALGSICGGLIFGSRTITKRSLAIRCGILAIGLAAAPLVMTFWGLAGTLFVASIGCAPALAAISAIIVGSVKFADTPESYGWVNSGQLVGIALCSGLAGVLIDMIGPAGGLIVGATAALLATIIAFIFRDSQPDLTDGVVEPPPTAPIELPR